MEKVNLNQKFSQFQDYWQPKIAGELNDTYIKLAKLKGEFVWHHHETEDELFLVVKGNLLIKLRDRDIWLEEGEFVIIPKGVEHLPGPVERRHPRAPRQQQRGYCPPEIAGGAGDDDGFAVHFKHSRWDRRL